MRNENEKAASEYPHACLGLSTIWKSGKYLGGGGGGFGLGPDNIHYSSSISSHQIP
jgi:hypothetical protein